MTAPYSVDLRERALGRKGAGETNREIAAALRISPSCVSKWTKRKRETGSLAPAQIGGYKPRTLSGESADWLRARIAAGPFTLRGLSAELAQRGIKTHPRAVWVFVHAEGLSELQKKRCWPRSRRVLTWRESGRDGRPIRAGSRPRGLCSSTRPPPSRGQALGEDQHGAPAGLGDEGPTAEGLCAPQPLEDLDLHRRAAPRQD
jgi:putative transposase